MNDLVETPAFGMEWLPAEAKFESPALTGRTAEELVEWALSNQIETAVSDAQAHIDRGQALHEAQATLYKDVTGKVISQERNERRSQIGGISKQWRALLAKKAEKLGIQREGTSLVSWAATEMQYFRDFSGALARVERQRISKQVHDVKRGSDRPITSSTVDSTPQIYEAEAEASAHERAYDGVREEFYTILAEIKALVPKVDTGSYARLLRTLYTTRDTFKENING